VRSSILALALFTLVLTLIVAPLPAFATEPGPGDACSQAGNFVRSGGPEVPGGGYMLICNGSTWQQVIRYSSAGLSGIGPSLSGAAAPSASGGAETDPQVGTLTSGKWCTTDGSAVNCTSDPPSGVAAFTDLTDSPADYTGAANKIVSVNGAGNALVFTTESDPKIGTLTNGKWCTTDGSAVNCTSDPPAAAPQLYRQIFTSSGTWTVPTGVTQAKVIAIGGGGGGGGGSSGANSAGAGGGGGGYADANVTGLTPGANITITVGAAGTSGAVNTTGGTGGNSSFSTTVVAGGGAGGGGTSSGAAGAGGTGTTGDFLQTGTSGLPGQSGYPVDGSNWGGVTSVPPYVGTGGSAGTAISVPGTAGTGYGSGGGGGARNAVGGAGSKGIVIIEWVQ